MKVRQISVFLENRSGQLAHICRIIADAGINMKALNIAETSDYGVLRIITDKPSKTVEVLSKDGLVCSNTDVVAISVPNVPGGLSKVLDIIAGKGISLEYSNLALLNVAFCVGRDVLECLHEALNLFVDFLTLCLNGEDAHEKHRCE